MEEFPDKSWSVSSINLLFAKDRRNIRNDRQIAEDRTSVVENKREMFEHLQKSFAAGAVQPRKFGEFERIRFLHDPWSKSSQISSKSRKYIVKKTFDFSILKKKYEKFWKFWKLFSSERRSMTQREAKKMKLISSFSNCRKTQTCQLWSQMLTDSMWTRVAGLSTRLSFHSRPPIRALFEIEFCRFAVLPDLNSVSIVASHFRMVLGLLR